MAPPTRTPRATWIDAGLAQLAAGGPDAVRVDPLARSLGVTRGGFHWHFGDRAAFLDALLDTWEQRTTEDVIHRVEDEGGDPRTKVRRAGELTFSDALAPVDLAVRDWARRDPAVAARLLRVDTRRMDYLRRLFGQLGLGTREAEARSMLAFSLVIGHHLLGVRHGALSREEVLELAVARLLGDLGPDAAAAPP